MTNTIKVFQNTERVTATIITLFGLNWIVKQNGSLSHTWMNKIKYAVSRNQSTLVVHSAVE